MSTLEKKLLEAWQAGANWQELKEIGRREAMAGTNNFLLADDVLAAAVGKGKEVSSETARAVRLAAKDGADERLLNHIIDAACAPCAGTPHTDEEARRLFPG